MSEKKNTQNVSQEIFEDKDIHNFANQSTIQDIENKLKASKHSQPLSSSKEQASTPQPSDISLTPTTPQEQLPKHTKHTPTTPQETIKPFLKFLEDLENPNIVYLGRKKSVLKQYGKTASAYVGRVAESQQQGKQVRIDGLNPHVIFLDGARGTGKSYLLGVIAEELATTNPYIGQIVIDPVGVFWSMKYPNRDPKELKILEEWDLQPEGLKNLKVFIPEGMKDQISKETYDDTFSMYPSLLNTDDWCLTFGIDRFSPSGLLLEKTLGAVKNGYSTQDGLKIPSRGEHFTLDDIINCLQNNSEFQSSQKGYKPDSIRALVSRFDASKSWGIFSDSGTPLSRLSRENQLTILDTSFLDENITALVIGILARRILSARKLLARQEAVKKFESATQTEELLEIEIPPTWMYIDEAHTLIPSGNTQTPATAGIIEYVKQGRRPGCSLVFATQQPSAINTKVLSQVDILISNKLVFNDDISAIQKRMPAIIPKQYKDPNFIKTLPFATALVGDRSEETSRAFILRAAPRKSQHEGRDAETIREVVKKSNSEILEIVFKLVYEKLEISKIIKVSFAKDILDVINIRYKGTVYWDLLLEKLLSKGVVCKHSNLYFTETFLEEKTSLPPKQEDLSLVEDAVEQQKLPPIKVKTRTTFLERVSKSKISEISKSNLKKNLLFFKSNEKVFSTILKYRALYKITFNTYDADSSFTQNTCYVDSVSGEFIHFIDGNFKISKGFTLLDSLDEHAVVLLKLLEQQQTMFSLKQKTNFDEEFILKHLLNFESLGIISSKKNDSILIYKINDSVFELPFSSTLKIFSSLDKLPLQKQDVEFIENIEHSLKTTQERLQKLFGELEFVSYEEIFWPIWHITYVKDDSYRSLRFDAITGKEM